MNKPPVRIFLQYHGDDEPTDDPVDLLDVCWAPERIFEHDVEYVKVEQLTAERELSGALREALINLYHNCEAYPRYLDGADEALAKYNAHKGE